MVKQYIVRHQQYSVRFFISIEVKDEGFINRVTNEQNYITWLGDIKYAYQLDWNKRLLKVYTNELVDGLDDRIFSYFINVIACCIDKDLMINEIRCMIEFETLNIFMDDKSMQSIINQFGHYQVVPN